MRIQLSAGFVHWSLIDSVYDMKLPNALCYPQTPRILGSEYPIKQNVSIIPLHFIVRGRSPVNNSHLSYQILYQAFVSRGVYFRISRRIVIGDICVPKSLALLCQVISDTGELLTGRRATTAALCLALSIVLISLPYIVITTCFRFVEFHLLAILCSIYTH